MGVYYNQYISMYEDLAKIANMTRDELKETAIAQISKATTYLTKRMQTENDKVVVRPKHKDGEILELKPDSTISYDLFITDQNFTQVAINPATYLRFNTLYESAFVKNFSTIGVVIVTIGCLTLIFLICYNWYRRMSEEGPRQNERLAKMQEERESERELGEDEEWESYGEENVEFEE